MVKKNRIITLVLAAAVLAVFASSLASAASVGPYWSNYASWQMTPSGTYTANNGDSVSLTSYWANDGNQHEISAPYDTQQLIPASTFSYDLWPSGTYRNTETKAVSPGAYNGQHRVYLAHFYDGASTGQTSNVVINKNY